MGGLPCINGKPFSQRAEQAASDLAFRKEITLQAHGQDKYGRTLADVRLLDETHVNHTLVKDGWCWWYRKDAPADTVLEGLENVSREGWKELLGRSASRAAVGVAEAIGEGPRTEGYETFNTRDLHRVFRLIFT